MKKRLIGGLIATLLVGGIGYGAGVGYYAEKFQPNSKFGSIDISNLTLEQAKDKITDDLNKQTVTITENGKEMGTFVFGDLGVSADVETLLNEAYESQDPTTWVMSFFDSSEFKDALSKTVQFDNDKVAQQLATLNLANEQRTPATDASIQYTPEKGYYIEAEKPGNQVDVAVLEAQILENVQSGQPTIDIKNAYKEADIKSDDEFITTVMDKIDKLASPTITLQIADKEEVINSDLIKTWIYFDEANNAQIDQEAVMAYLKTLNDKYATYDDYRDFQSTWQGTISIQPGTLGWSIDRETESANIMADIQAGKDVKRDVAIAGTGYASGDDIGNSYVEVSIPDQTMFIYLDGQLVLQTPVVTGWSGGSATVPGAYSIWNKEAGATLKGTNTRTGKDYAQPVDYWLPFDASGQGIHDAAWQSSFGGDRYTYAGSQGCVNTPPDVMGTVFELVYIGMPVIVY